MMSSVLDSKLKELIKACKKTENMKKLAVVSFILIGNMVDEISIRLGVKPRNKKKGETIREHMDLINDFLRKNLKFELFKAENIDIIGGIEHEFIKNEGNIPLQYIQEIFSNYYELRKLELPNLYDRANNERLNEIEGYGLSSFLSGYVSNKGGKQDLNIKSLILREINEREKVIKRKLEQEFDKQLFEEKLYLRNLGRSIENDGKKKIKVSGKLKDNINYKQTLSELFGLSFIGVFLLFLLLGVVLVIETIFYPELTSILSPLLLTFFGASFLSFIIYWNYFKNNQESRGRNPHYS